MHTISVSKNACPGWVGAALILVAAHCSAPLHAASVFDTPIFDSYTGPPSYSGYSSPNAGLAAQISVTRDTLVTAIGINNQMLATGNLMFLILGQPSHTILYQSAPVSFNTESSFSWKLSPSMSFQLTAGQQYWIGYVRSVSVNDRGDNVRESSNGITSVGNTASISGFGAPSFSHVVFYGSDCPVRLYTIPEPAMALPALAGLLAPLARRRRCRGS